MILIEDPDDPRVDPYRQIRERDLVGRQGMFVAEGEVVLRTLVRASRHRLHSLLIDQRRAIGLADALASAAPAPVYLASQAVLDRIAGFHIHRGILAIGRRRPEPTADQLLAGLPDRGVVLALFGIGNHDNLGGIFRNAAAFGVHGVLLDSDCCDPLYRKSIRVSVGAALTVPFARLGGGDIFDLFHCRGIEPIALTPAGETRLADLAPPARTALMLGSEGPGLPEELLARARRVAIPMAGGFDSLNVATACGIALHWLTPG